MIDGLILKGIGGFYYVDTGEEVVECRARGNFREEGITPLIGDKVKIRINKEDNTGYIEEIYKRSTKLIRPPVANITQAIIVMSIKKPKINSWLLDRFLMMAEAEGLNVTICINKVDLDLESAIKIKEIYTNIGYKVIMTSTKTELGIDELKMSLNNNISVFAGPSGVGKSSLLNFINPEYKLKTGEISEKNKRGKHTTRHTELLHLKDNSYVLDSPGFSSLDINFIEYNTQLGDYFIEIKEHAKKCKFINCLHSSEPGCEVKKQVEVGEISKERYENYLLFLEEVKNNRRY